jgi:hypothetical protein
MAVMWFWIAPGIAYVIFGLFNLIAAWGLRRMHTKSEETKLAKYWSQEEIDKMKRESFAFFQEQQKLFSEGKISQQEANRAQQLYVSVLTLETQVEAAKNILNAARLNRWVLWIAAGSLFVAAAVSLAQGLAII